MPELPEVETVRRTLARHVEGRTIVNAEFLSALCADRKPEELRKSIEGRRIVSLKRHGKHLLFELDGGWLDVHLRMTGKLLASGARTAHTRAVVGLDTGSILFDDVRQFGRMRFIESIEGLGLGPDALGLQETVFAAILKAHRARIKPLLLDQGAVAGIGNIYADEALHAAGIHPCAVSSRLSGARAKRLHEAVQKILEGAIRAGGSSISDYVDAAGNRGGYQSMHLVYGRTGKPCAACGAPIRRMVLQQRATHFCPRCQRR